ncbi:hypothetical protein ACJX0J_037954, partial [Zea mays]
VVTEFINGLVDIYPDLQYLEEFPHIKVVHRVEVEHSSYDKVAVISGGQSGHEPTHAGFVGPGMLTAAVSREVFTSLPVDSILAIVRAVTGSKGCYTDAKMCENGALDEGFKQAKSEGYNMEMVVAGAGCVFSPPRGIAGRRGSARTIIVHKVAEEAKPASEVDVTMGVALSVCTLPEQVTSGSLGQRQLELGLRIHGELGVAVVELQSVDIVAEHVLKQIVSRETQYLPNTRGCNDVLLVNGLGATPIIELMIAAVPELQLVYDIAIDRVYTGTLLTSLDMAGLSITVMKSDQSILRRLDVPTKALAWPVGYEGTRPPAKFHVPLAPSPSMKDDEILAPSQELSKQFLMFHMHQQSFPCAPTWGQVGSLGGGNLRMFYGSQAMQDEEKQDSRDTATGSSSASDPAGGWMRTSQVPPGLPANASPFATHVAWTRDEIAAHVDRIESLFESVYLYASLDWKIHMECGGGARAGAAGRRQPTGRGWPARGSRMGLGEDELGAGEGDAEPRERAVDSAEQDLH